VVYIHGVNAESVMAHAAPGSGPAAPIPATTQWGRTSHAAPLPGTVSTGAESIDPAARASTETTVLRI
jgi:hypothetical protein